VAAAGGHKGQQRTYLRQLRKKRPYGRLLLILGLLLICYVYLGGDYGLLKIWSQRKEIGDLERETHRLQAEQMDLKQECKQLKTDSLYIEKKAREELGMVREDERVYQFVPQADSSERGEI
jgi:cell division protein FtsB